MNVYKAQMPTCPICKQPLDTVRQREGVYYSCRSCNGRAVTVSQIRHVIGDQIAAKLLRLIKSGRSASKHPCPFCGKAMLTIRAQEPRLELESCRPCAVVWFDLPTYQSLPQLAVETTNSIQLHSTEIIAMDRLKELKEREKEREREEKKKRLHRLLGTKRTE